MKGIDQLKKVRETLQEIDANWRANSICPKCQKPQSGFIPVGMTREEAGLCICPLEETTGEQDEKDQQ